MAGRRTGLLASGNRSAAPSRGLCVVPSGRRQSASGFLRPGHSGGTAPASHRTSLDHRPYLRERVYPAREIPAQRPTFVTNPALNFSIQRATRASRGPSLAACSQGLRIRFPKRSASTSASALAVPPACCSLLSQRCWVSRRSVGTYGPCVAWWAATSSVWAFI